MSDTFPHTFVHLSQPLLLNNPSLPSHFFKKDFFVSFLKILFIYLERGEGEEKERENINVWLPLMCPYWGPGPQPRHVP